MLPIKVGKYSLTLPQTEQEMDTDIYKLISGIILQQKDEETQAKILFHIIIAQLKHRERRIFDKGYIDGWAISLLCDEIEWIWKRFDITAKSQVVPWIQELRWRGKIHLMPQPNFNDVSLDEYSYINMYLDKIAAGDQDGIYSLAATVYRPIRKKKELTATDFDGNPRIQFNPNLIDAEPYRKAPAWMLWNAYDMSLRAQKLIHVKYEPLFNGPKTSGPNFGWLGMIINVGESGTYGNAQQVKKENIHTICIYAVKKVLEQRRNEEEMEKIRSKNARS